MAHADVEPAAGGGDVRGVVAGRGGGGGGGGGVRGGGVARSGGFAGFRLGGAPSLWPNRQAGGVFRGGGFPGSGFRGGGGGGGGGFRVGGSGGGGGGEAARAAAEAERAVQRESLAFRLQQQFPGIPQVPAGGFRPLLRAAPPTAAGAELDFPRRRLPATGYDWPSKPRAERGIAANEWGLMCCEQCSAGVLDSTRFLFTCADGRTYRQTAGRAYCRCDSGTDIDEDD